MAVQQENLDPHVDGWEWLLRLYLVSSGVELLEVSVCWRWWNVFLIVCTGNYYFSSEYSCAFSDNAKPFCICLGWTALKRSWFCFIHRRGKRPNLFFSIRKNLTHILFPLLGKNLAYVIKTGGFSPLLLLPSRKTYFICLLPSFCGASLRTCWGGGLCFNHF